MNWIKNLLSEGDAVSSKRFAWLNPMQHIANHLRLLLNYDTN